MPICLHFCRSKAPKVHFGKVLRDQSEETRLWTRALAYFTPRVHFFGFFLSSLLHFGTVSLQIATKIQFWRDHQNSLWNLSFKIKFGHVWYILWSVAHGLQNMFKNILKYTSFPVSLPKASKVYTFGVSKLSILPFGGNSGEGFTFYVKSIDLSLFDLQKWR